MSILVANNNTVKDCLSVSILNQNKRILRPTKCPTKTCEECKINYVDRLGLDIFVICKCNCHKIKGSSDRKKWAISQII